MPPIRPIIRIPLILPCPLIWARRKASGPAAHVFRDFMQDISYAWSQISLLLYFKQ
jgi:hypothetical protein